MADALSDLISKIAWKPTPFYGVEGQDVSFSVVGMVGNSRSAERRAIRITSFAEAIP